MILNFKNVENALKIEREKHINVKKYNFQHNSREKHKQKPSKMSKKSLLFNHRRRRSLKKVTHQRNRGIENVGLADKRRQRSCQKAKMPRNIVGPTT